MIEQNYTAGFLLERADTEGPAQYLGANGEFYWTLIPMDALRFVRRADAEMFAKTVLLLTRIMPLPATLPGFRDGDILPYAREHAWMQP